MKRLLSILIIFTTCTASYAQSYRMVDTSAPVVNEVIPETRYDSLSNIRPYKDVTYYKQFIGQSILFYPRHPESKSLPEYFANFTTPRYQVASIDTIWHKRRKNPRPKDYELKKITTNKYKAHLVINKKVTLCGSKSTFYDDNMQKIYPYSMVKLVNIPTLYNGSYTPYNEIEGKIFKILNITHTGEGYSGSTIFTLESESRDTLYWHAGRGEYNQVKHKDQQYPVIVVGFIEKMKQIYLNKDLHVNNFNLMTKYRCCDLVYFGKQDQYIVPSFILENGEENGERIIPLSSTPSIFSYETDEYDKPYKDNQKPFWELAIMTHEEYEQTIENERLAQAEKLEKERIAKANEEKERVLAEQKRIQYLNKKFGARIGKLILNGEVQIGMTYEMCRESWGSPERVNTTTTAYTVSEQWVYGRNSYLYFTNGRLTAIQN